MDSKDFEFRTLEVCANCIDYPGCQGCLFKWMLDEKKGKTIEDAVAPSLILEVEH